MNLSWILLVIKLKKYRDRSILWPAQGESFLANIRVALLARHSARSRPRSSGGRVCSEILCCARARVHDEHASAVFNTSCFSSSDPSLELFAGRTCSTERNLQREQLRAWKPAKPE